MGSLVRRGLSAWIRGRQILSAGCPLGRSLRGASGGLSPTADPFGDDNRKGKAGGRPRDSNIDGELNSSRSFDCVWSKSAPNFAQDDGVLVLG